MTIMTPTQSDDWLTEHRRKRREEIAQYHRSRMRLVINRGITPLELPDWYRMRRRSSEGGDVP